MSRGITIADLVQQVYYAIYKVRLDVDESLEGAYHSKTDKFKEVVMEANMVLQDLQKDADWNWLRKTWDMGHAENYRHVAPQKIKIPDYVYKVCTGYGDAVRGHHHRGFHSHEIPFTSPHQGKRPITKMFDEYGMLNTVDQQNRAYITGDILTFTRPWFPSEEGMHLETDVIELMEPFHICDDNCPDHCPIAYEHVHLRQMPDPYYLVVKTAARRAEGDPSVADRVQSLTDEAAKLMSAMRENDSAHTIPDSYETCSLGFVEVL